LNRYLLRLVPPALAAALALAPGACKRTEREPAPPPPPPMQMPPLPGGAVGSGPALPGPGPGASDVQRRIAGEEQLVAQEPKNVQAWIALGNDYFDTKQPQRAVDAYARALELAPNNPDVLTDQGVMYRELRAFDKAVANFQKASQLDPRHVQSTYNLGVVYAYDLKDREKAFAAWRRVVEIAPQSPQAAQAAQAMSELQASPPAR
jgi:cytochrome c-type biogenesis protein CcmH/NrfG